MTAEDLVMFDNRKLLDFFKIDQCPEWAEWVAVDKDGTVCYYSGEPIIFTCADEWTCNSPSHKLQPVKIGGINIKITVEDWMKAKVKRPPTDNEMFLGKCKNIYVYKKDSKYVVSFECRTEDTHDNDSYYLELTVELSAGILARDLGYIIAEWLGKEVSVETKGSQIRSALQSSIPDSFSAAVTDVRLYSSLSTAQGECQLNFLTNMQR